MCLQKSMNMILYICALGNIVTYDENGNIIGLNYNNTQYYYIRNGQNDVIGILDNNLNQVVSYEYDSWGNTISIKDANGNDITDSSNIGIINTYRYRSYRYDTEIGLYYLNSRYYNPEWGRFINFDNYGGQVGELLSHNGYAYCMNNPVNMVDENGNMAISGTVAGVAVLVVGFLAILATTQETCKQAINDLGNAITSVGNYIDQKRRKDEERNHTVYQLRNETTHEIVYIGRTTNPKSRKYVHEKTKPGNNFEVIANNLTRREARGMEQYYIIKENTKNYLNKINGISRNNGNVGLYMKEGAKAMTRSFGNIVEDEILYWYKK